MEHFEELLNRPAPQEPPNIQPADCDLPIDCGVPTKEEIRQAVKQLKNGKSAGPDIIPAEAMKADIEASVEMLDPLFSQIWEEEKVPSESKEGYLIKIPKKGDLSSSSNYRGITLLSIPGKVFNRVLLNRMKDAVDPQLRDQQADFRKDRSCTDQIATLRIILEQLREWNSPFYVNFIDYEKAFDSGRQTVPLGAAEILRCPGEAHKHHPGLIRGDDLQGGPWPATHRRLPSKDGSEARMLPVAFTVPASSRLGYEDIYSPEAKWHPMDALDTAGRP